MSNAQKTNEEEGWETVVSKRTKKLQKRHAHKSERMLVQRDRDVLYLRSHHGFQRCRLRVNKINQILDALDDISPPIEGTWLIGAQGGCRGHIFGWNSENTICGECLAHVGDTHCCCSEETRKFLPRNFYLGFEGSVMDYITAMDTRHS